MQISWRTSPSVTCYHAANQVRLGRHLLNSDLEAALHEPVEGLQRSLSEEYLSADAFWGIVVPMSGEFSMPRRLAEVTLTKLMGSTEAQPRVGRFERNLQAVRSAFLPHQKPATDSPGPVQEAWKRDSAGLLGGLANWTEPGLLAESAVVFLMPNLSNGGGEAHPVFNSVRIEEAAESPHRPMEILRLAWLLGQLNLDVPRYSEAVPGERRHLVASLSMIPIALAAAEFSRIGDCTTESIHQAVEAWLGPAEQIAHWQKAITDWWDVYKLQRPPWPAAMQALDGLL